MTSIVLKDVAADIELITDDPEERFMTTGVSWQQYEHLLAQLADTSRYRVTYLEGVLEIMAPSRRHEVDKKNIGRLLEAYFEETRTRFWGLGSTTFRQQGKSGGTEPDECYCLDTEKDIPDLAIEIVVTRGGVDKLAVYQRLGVREVWFWYRDRFEVYHLSGERYEAVPESQLLPELNLALLATHVMQPDPLDALLSYRAEVRAGGSCG